MRTNAIDRPLVFVDTETTGLDSKIHVVLEVGILKVDPKTLTVIDEYDATIDPTTLGPFEVSEDALRVNGLDLKELVRTGRPAAEVATRVASMLRGATFCGQNPAFDRGFLNALLGRFSLKVDAPYAMLDTASLAWPLLVAGEIDSVKLATVCERFGVMNVAKHRALSDARATFEVYKKLMASLKVSLAA
ncbi:MAG: 3'-5' exonuclease [Chlorobiaceae bacterium]